ncbi:hypothetical protein EDD15DRAFT_2301929 [Pisolithus albus]|nr:hypothetical protein EDD15DRAFT_2301929 [Pisolithus albus]
MHASASSRTSSSSATELAVLTWLIPLLVMLAEPARSEWERRLEASQLREDQWEVVSSEDQQAVMHVFVGFFGDEADDDDDEDGDIQVAVAGPSSSEADECATQDLSGGFHPVTTG